MGTRTTIRADDTGFCLATVSQRFTCWNECSHDTLRLHATMRTQSLRRRRLIMVHPVSGKHVFCSFVLHWPRACEEFQQLYGSHRLVWMPSTLHRHLMVMVLHVKARSVKAKTSSFRSFPFGFACKARLFSYRHTSSTPQPWAESSSRMPLPLHAFARHELSTDIQGIHL